MQVRPVPSCGVCLSVCVSVSLTFILSVEMNKDIFKFFSLSGSQAILVFPYQMAYNIPTGSHAGGVGRYRDSQPISGFFACCECCEGELLSADTWLSIDACWS